MAFLGLAELVEDEDVNELGDEEGVEVAAGGEDDVEHTPRASQGSNWVGCEGGGLSWALQVHTDRLGQLSSGSSRHDDPDETHS